MLLALNLHAYHLLSLISLAHYGRMALLFERQRGYVNLVCQVIVFIAF
jgi:hypothetical protein